MTFRLHWGVFAATMFPFWCAHWSPAHAQTATASFEPLAVSAPFATDRAINRLQADMRLPPGVEPLLRSIDEIGYVFQPSVECSWGAAICGSGQPSPQGWVKSVRYIEYDATQIQTAVAAALNAHEKSGCSRLKFGEPRLIGTSDRELTYVASISAKKRACSRGFKTDIAKGDGKVILRVKLDLAGPDYTSPDSRGSLALTGEGRAEIKSKLLGFVSADTVAGDILGQIARISAIVVDNLSLRTVDLGLDQVAEALEGPLTLGMAWDAEAETSGLRRTSEFYDRYHRVFTGRQAVFLDVDQTGFRTANGRLKLRVAHFTVNTFLAYRSIYRDKVVQELKFLDDLDEEPAAIIVARGDSLKSIAKRRYGFESAAYVLAATNGVTDRRLRVEEGATIVIPPYWGLVSLEKFLVQPGDTLWQRYKSELGPSIWSPRSIPRPIGSTSIHRIYPMQIVDVCGVAIERRIRLASVKLGEALPELRVEATPSGDLRLLGTDSQQVDILSGGRARLISACVGKGEEFDVTASRRSSRSEWLVVIKNRRQWGRRDTSSP